jgi:molybdopterin-guanine dinucleotide biosynthesis protein A
MGGVDKGMQMFNGQTLVERAITRLQQQSSGAPGLIAINANRNQDRYATLGTPVWSDMVPDYAGPLAGFLSAMQQCQGHYAYVLSVPCDSPLFPLDLLERLAAALVAEKAEIAVALGPDVQADGSMVLRPQPVFCLMQSKLANSLQTFISEGGRKIGAWTAGHRQARVAFNAPFDDVRAFTNANTLDELHAMEKP